MTADPQVERALRTLFRDDVTVLPDRILDDVVADLPTTRQHKRIDWGAWLRRSTPLRFAAIAAVFVVALLAGSAWLGQPGGVGGPPPSEPAATVTAPSPTPTPSPGYATTPPVWPTPPPIAPTTPLPDPQGSSLPQELIGRQYNTQPLDTQGDQAFVLTLRGPDDEHCAALYGGRSTCFTMLWTPNYPKHVTDPGVRGPARMVDGRLVLEFALVENDPACEGTSSTYTVSEDGWTLSGVDVPSCSFQAFTRH